MSARDRELMMHPMPEIDELLDADHLNVPGTKSALAQFHVDMPGLFEKAAVLYRTCQRATEGWIDPDLASASDLLAGLGEPHPELLARLFDGGELPEGVADVPEHEVIRAALSRTRASYLRALLHLVVSRSYMWGVTDYLRQRATSTLGYLRTQAEALALASLFIDDPSIASAWQSARTHQDGRDFHRTYNSRVAERVRDLALYDAYEWGSASSQHVRIASVARGFEQEAIVSGDIRTRQLRLVFQELDPKRPRDFFGVGILVLETQRRIFAALPRVFPEIDDALLLQTRLPAFAADVDRMRNHFRERYFVAGTAAGGVV